MGMPAGNDPGNWPPDGSLPGLPSGWGPIVVPDDASELAEEADRVRFELRRQARRRRWRRRLRPLVGANPAARAPALVLAVAIFTVLAALLGLGSIGNRAAPPQDRAQPDAQSPGSPPTASGAARGLSPPGVLPSELPALDLLDRAGQAVSVRALLPAVVLLTEGCACDALIAAGAAATPPGVTVVVVASRVPSLPPIDNPNRVRPLADPAGELRSLIGVPDSTPLAGVLLVAATGAIVRTLPAVASVEEFRPHLDLLADR